MSAFSICSMFSHHSAGVLVYGSVALSSRPGEYSLQSTSTPLKIGSHVKGMIESGACSPGSLSSLLRISLNDPTYAGSSTGAGLTHQ